MGGYYYFYNVTREQHNDYPIPGYGQSNFVVKFNWLPEPDACKVFQNIIMANGWSDRDVIRASSEYEDYPSVMYNNGSVIYVNTIDNEPDSEHSDTDDYDELYYEEEHNPFIPEEASNSTAYPEKTADDINQEYQEYQEEDHTYDHYEEDYDY